MHRIGFQIILVISGIMLAASLGLLLHGRFQLERLGAEVEQTYRGLFRDHSEHFIARLTREQADRYDIRFADYLKRVRMVSAAVTQRYDEMSELPDDGGFPADYFSRPYDNGVWTSSTESDVARFYWAGEAFPAAVKQELAAIAEIDGLLLQTEQEDPLSVAAWVITASGAASYVPNSDPAKTLPTGFDMRDPENDPFYNYAAPLWNPQRVARFGELYLDPLGHGMMVSAVAPVYDRSGTFKAVAGIDIALEEIRSDVLKFQGIRQDVASAGFAFLIGSDGRAVAFPDEHLGLIGLRTPDDLLNLNLLDTRVPRFNQLVARMVSGESDVMEVALGQEGYLIGFHPMPSADWSLGLAIPLKEMLSVTRGTEEALQTSLNRSSQQGALVALLGLVVMGLMITLFVNRRLVRPILQLNRAAQQIGEGELDVLIPVRGRDELGKLGRNLASMRDAVRESLEQVGASERIMSEIINNASAVISLKSPEGRYLLVNQKFASLFGGTAEEYVGRADASVPGAGAFQSPSRTVSRYGIPVEVEESLTHSDGAVHHYITLKFPLRDADGKIYAVCAISSDITSQKRSDQERITAENRRRSAEETRDNLRLLNARIEEKSRQVRELLDNSAQGFFSFGVDLVVGPECSSAAERIFGGSPAGLDISTLLFPGRKDQWEFFAKIISRVLETDDEHRRELYLSLLPTEYQIRDRFYTAEFKPAEDHSIVLIMTDVTQEHLLEDRAEAERRRLEFVVAVVSEPTAAFGLVEEFERFIGGGYRRMLAGAGDRAQKFAEIYRRIHTFKGTFDQWGFLNLPAELHALETALGALGEGEDPPSPNVLRDLLDAAPLSQRVYQDLTVLKQTLGPDFMSSRGRMRIDKNVLQGILGQLDGLAAGRDMVPSSDVRKLRKDLHRLSDIDLTGRISAFRGAVERIAERLEKSVIFQVYGDPIWVDPDRFGPLEGSLINLFRNAVDHGIESPERRVEVGKEPSGTVACYVSVAEGELCLVIEDDGAGIDFESVLSTAQRRGLIGEERAPDQVNLVEFLFRDRFTTRDAVSSFSGRGVGLSAVKAEVDRLGGHIEVETRLSQGTKISISVALEAELGE